MRQMALDWTLSRRQRVDFGAPTKTWEQFFANQEPSVLLKKDKNVFNAKISFPVWALHLSFQPVSQRDIFIAYVFSNIPR